MVSVNQLLPRLAYGEQCETLLPTVIVIVETVISAATEELMEPPEPSKLCVRGDGFCTPFVRVSHLQVTSPTLFGPEGKQLWNLSQEDCACT